MGSGLDLKPSGWAGPLLREARQGERENHCARGSRPALKLGFGLMEQRFLGVLRLRYLRRYLQSFLARGLWRRPRNLFQ